MEFVDKPIRQTKFLKGKIMIIREDNDQEIEEIKNVVKKAFENAEHSDGSEHLLVEALRSSENFIKKLSLVAVEDNIIIGYILFTKIKIGKDEELALAPLAVLPEFQRKGVGKALIKEGHKIAKEFGYHFSVVLGSENYYPKFGYSAASKWDIKAPFEVDDKNYMAKKLCNGAYKVCGTVEYAKEFGF